MIQILTQEVELDFMHAGVWCGLGFQGGHLCKAKRTAKEHASTLMYEEAQIRVEELECQKLKIESFSVDSTFYLVSLEQQEIASCSCPEYAGSALICKHMFLAQCVTNYTISQPHVIVPTWRSHEPEEEEILESQWASKVRLVEKIEESMALSAGWRYWCHNTFMNAQPLNQHVGIHADHFKFIQTIGAGNAVLLKNTNSTLPVNTQKMKSASGFAILALNPEELNNYQNGTLST
ncbi:hypothetical protein M422DRAFT_261085 [Sphaerobolus stellatus SS14]|uniref:SWIM-type domain-containing protein n=1 Tax=Sphaerobolus stellatus (strain SS14) TaxID=990650 RepID=A0A0C9VG01_SPHS4|nr:hypothetical protein M422DRAFT_261085 [Sphaerobolus stellatus SS14]